MLRLRAILAAVITLFLSALADAKDADTISSLFTSDGRVATLTRASFMSSVLESRTPALVWFYSGSDCPSCESLANVLETAAEKLTAWGVHVGAVDVDGQAKLAKEIGLAKSTFALNVYFGTFSTNPYGGLPIRRHQALSYVKDARELQKQVLSIIPNMVTSVDLTGMSMGDDSGTVAEKASVLRESVHDGDGKYTMTLVTSSGKSSPLLRVLASELSDGVDAVQVRVPRFGDGTSLVVDGSSDESQQLVSRVVAKALDVVGGIPRLPSIVLVNKETNESVLFPGDSNDAKAIMEFIRANIPSSSSSSSSSSAGDKPPGESSTKTGDGRGAADGVIGDVLHLDPDRLATLAERGADALVVAVVEGGHEEGMKESIPGWGAAAKGLQGQIRAGILDCIAYPTAPPCEGDVASGKAKPPYIRVYPHKEGAAGSTRGYPSVFPASKLDEAVKEADDSLPEVVTVIPGGMGPQRTHDAMQGFIGTALIGDEQTGALIVMSKREEPNLVVRTVASQFYPYGIRTVFVSQPDKETLARLSISKVPAMMLLFRAPEDSDYQKFHEDGRPVDPSEQAMVTALYSPAQWGPLSHRSATEFILSHISRVDTEVFGEALVGMEESAKLTGETLPVQISTVLAQWRAAKEGTEGGASPKGERDSPAKPVPFRGVPEVSAEAWKAMVNGDDTGGSPPRILGVFLLDRLAEGFEGALKAAETAAARAVETGAGGKFFWADAPCQEEFSKALGVSDPAEVPVLTVYSPRHERSGRYVGAWEPESLASYLRQAIGGRAPMFPVDGDLRPGMVDCSQRLGAEASGEGKGAEIAEEDDMSDFMAEIQAEEAESKREREEAVAKALEELKEQEEMDAAEEAKPKKRTKIVKRKKKKKKTTSSGGSDGEL